MVVTGFPGASNLTPQREKSVDIVIVGAGPAGLTAAYLLTKAGQSVAVIERDAVRVGGISRTVELERFPQRLIR